MVVRRYLVSMICITGILMMVILGILHYNNSYTLDIYELYNIENIDVVLDSIKLNDHSYAAFKAGDMIYAVNIGRMDIGDYRIIGDPAIVNIQNENIDTIRDGYLEQTFSSISDLVEYVEQIKFGPLAVYKILTIIYFVLLIIFGILVAIYLTYRFRHG